MPHPKIYKNVPEFVVYRDNGFKGSLREGFTTDWYRCGEHLSEDSIIESYRKNRDKFESGEFKAFRLTPVAFDTIVKIRENT